ncbi:unnamed protein product [Acanthoscelides obtectus]|uniref:Uncharacterized protein n=1 Tax=Acanthoscelides obtectus TaxID=200917 RepID=A0A9P0VS71_ACAOB|nr:unnamed protein product [Acanthoscelides obtectus]CAK1687901.1 hypothetical protein AOBTE_LOCUS36445 [Acanthoscelides obtectus]
MVLPKTPNLLWARKKLPRTVVELLSQHTGTMDRDNVSDAFKTMDTSCSLVAWGLDIFWEREYLLQAVLSFNGSYEVPS